MVIRFKDKLGNNYEIDVTKISNIHRDNDVLIVVTTDGTEYTVMHWIRFESAWC